MPIHLYTLSSRMPSTWIIFYRAEQKYNLIYYYNNNKQQNKQMAWESECKWTCGRDMSGLQILEIVSQRSTHNTIVHNYQVVELEKAMVPHSSTLAWKIPWTEEPGRLQSLGSWRVGHDWATLLSLFTFMHWRRKWQPTPVFLPGESQGWGILVDCHLWGRTESDTTEAT